MKKMLLLMVLVTLATVGCASRYKITLNNGNTITTQGKPHYNPENGTYTFKDSFGKPASIPQFRIKEIEAL